MERSNLRLHRPRPSARSGFEPGAGSPAQRRRDAPRDRLPSSPRADPRRGRGRRAALPDELRHRRPRRTPGGRVARPPRAARGGDRRAARERRPLCSDDAEPRHWCARPRNAEGARGLSASHRDNGAPAVRRLCVSRAPRAGPRRRPGRGGLTLTLVACERDPQSQLATRPAVSDCWASVSSSRSRPARSAKSLLESRVVVYSGEVVVPTRILAEPREQFDGPPEMAKRGVSGVAREGCEARVVVIEARVVRHALEGSADRFERVVVALFTVGGHGLSVERPRLTPDDPLVRLPRRGADSEDGSVPGRLSPRLRPDGHERPGRRVERYAVYLEGRLAVEHDVQLLLARPGLVVLVDQRRVLAGRVGVDSECVDPEVLAHRNISAAPLDVVEACDLPVRLVVHPITSV